MSRLRLKRLLHFCLIFASALALATLNAQAADGYDTIQGWTFVSYPGPGTIFSGFGVYPDDPDVVAVTAPGSADFPDPNDPSRPFVLLNNSWSSTNGTPGLRALAPTSMDIFVPNYPGVAGTRTLRVEVDTPCDFLCELFNAGPAHAVVASVTAVGGGPDDPVVECESLSPEPSLVVQECTISPSSDWETVHVTAPFFGQVDRVLIETSIEVDAVITIDIKPGSDDNPINPKSKGKIPVAILSAGSFDAPNDVLVPMLTFGRTGDEMSLARNVCNPEDVDFDGDVDLQCHFDTQAAAFEAGDELGILKGCLMDADMTPFEASDVVKIVGGGNNK